MEGEKSKGINPNRESSYEDISKRTTIESK